MTNLQALILAVGIAVAGIGYAVAQGTAIRSPAAVNGCIYRESPLTLQDGQQTSFTCDSTGKLRVTTS